MKYIDAEKLKAEIKRLKERAEAERVLYPKTILSAKNYLLIQDYNSLLRFITSLQREQPLTTEKVVEQCKKFGENPEVIQQEQPEVELEKEIARENEKWTCYEEIGFGALYDARPFDGRDIDRIARHFYELGQSAMRERIINPEYNQKIIEKMKSEYPADEFNARKV